MENVKLGQLIEKGSASQRDAIHVAVMPVTAAEDLKPGAKIAFVYGTKNMVKQEHYRPVGVVDPFLDTYQVDKGEEFFMMLFPGTITGLRHEWTHPDIDRPAPTNEHEKWLREFASRWNFDYDEMIQQASAPSTEGSWNYITANGVDLHNKYELGADHDLFWSHLECVVDKFFDQGHRDRFVWSCSC